MHERLLERVDGGEYVVSQRDMADVLSWRLKCLCGSVCRTIGASRPKLDGADIRHEEIGHLRLLSLQELLSRLASEERDEILSADAKHPLASFVPLRLRPHVNAALHG